ncbi:hypothetical protein [Streptomyces sp. NPDC058653]|uniref:hypothetical protein n=1 Tax=Streptomyces sp. NPDC058653 TaxID=3346576 RepID=UPI0036582E3C
MNVDLDAQELTVAKEIVVDGWTPVEDVPKTDGSAATIGLDRATVQALREHKARQDAEREAAGRSGSRGTRCSRPSWASGCTPTS